MGKKAVIKTNALRQLEQKKIPFSIYTYDTTDGAIDGISVAQKINQATERVFKTLVTQSSPHDLYVFVIPVEKELALKKAAKVADVKKIDLLPVHDLLRHTGYIRGGCSPIGMKKAFPTFIDESASQMKSIIVSAGKIGVQVEVEVTQLQNITKATFANITL